jgi:hypothetical protein
LIALSSGVLLYCPPTEKGEREKKGKRERKKKRSYEGITIHCDEEEVEKKTRLITELERSIV